MTITKFGMASPKLYTFNYVQTYSDNFKAATPRVDRLMGVSGGLSQYGRNPAQGEVGKVTLSFMLKAYDRSEMTAKRDAVNAMRWWGEQLLWLQTTNYPTEVMRFCRAVVNDIQMPEEPARHTDLHQRVTIIFQAADPRWLAWPGTPWSWDDGTLWGAKNWVTPRFSSTTINAASTIALTNNGNAPTPLIIRVRAAANVTNFELGLLSDTGAIVSGFRYANTLASATSDLLTVDGEALSVLHDQRTGAGISSGYPFFTRLNGNGFIQLPPGTSTLRVSGSFSGNVALEIDYYDAWS